MSNTQDSPITGYQIIYLNGSTSVGKSTLARVLQDKLEKPFLVIGYDLIIPMMPKKLNDTVHEAGDPASGWVPAGPVEGYGWEIVHDNNGSPVYKPTSGQFGLKMEQALYDIITLLARTGHYLIIDDVACGKENVDIWRNVLQEFKVLWVGVTAPIEVIEAREKMRKDRKIGSARWQAENVHTDVIYDVMLENPDRQSIEKNVDIIQKLVQKLES